MVSSSDDNKRKRMDKILEANTKLIKFDKLNVFGSVTFHFKKDEGIARAEIHYFESMGSTFNNNNVTVFNGSFK